MPQHAAFLYQPLPTPTSTRVLTLLPGADDTPIHIRLNVIDLARSPKYQAVSYTWGSEGNEHTVYLNYKPVEIRYNLFTFLFRLRQQIRKQRTLWVDAISISQVDLDEKGQQVSIIGKIFSLAQRVLVWLGEHADGSEHIIRFRPKHNVLLRHVLRGFRPREPVEEQLSEEATQTRALRWGELLDRPYWRRAWIIQEVAQAGSITVHCGNDYQDWIQLFHYTGVPWGRFDLAQKAETYRLWDEAGEIPEDAGTIELHSGVHEISTLLQPLHGLERVRLSRSHNSHATSLAIFLSTLSKMDPRCVERRDKVYAFLSLDTSHTRIVPDYRTPMPELFLRLYNEHVKFHPLKSTSHLTLTEANGEVKTHISWRSEIVRELIRYMELTEVELNQVLEIALNTDSRTTITDDYAYLGPIAYAIACFLRDAMVVGEIATHALKGRWNPAEEDYAAGLAGLRYEATLLVEPMNGEGAWLQHRGPLDEGGEYIY